MNNQFSRCYSNQQPSRTAQQRSSPKVISVPVHFISSDQPRMTLSMLKDSAAVRIQRAFRGFLVRKIVKKIASIRNDVDEIERRISDIEVMDMIRRDVKERLRVNETLMSLLFNLDSIRGVDCGIRDLRKTVTRKAIALQEKVDSMAQADDHDHQTLDSYSPNNDSAKIDGTSVNSEAVEDGGVKNEIIANCKTVKSADERDVEEDVETSPGSSEMRKEDHKGSMEVQQEVNDMGNREEFEKLMADNSLSQRVEQLEKAFMTERMRKKNKKTQHIALRRKRERDYKFCIFGANSL